MQNIIENEIYVLVRNPANQPLDVMPERIFYECHQRPDTEICLSFLDKFCLKDKHPSLNLKLKTSRRFANSNKSSVSDAIVEFCLWQNCSKVEKWKPPKPAAVTAIQDLPHQGPQMPFWAPGYFSSFNNLWEKSSLLSWSMWTSWSKWELVYRTSHNFREVHSALLSEELASPH